MYALYGLCDPCCYMYSMVFDLSRILVPVAHSRSAVCSKARLARSSSTYVAGTVAPDFVVYATTTSLKNRYYVAPSIVLLRTVVHVLRTNMYYCIVGTRHWRAIFLAKNSIGEQYFSSDNCIGLERAQHLVNTSSMAEPS